MWYWHRNEAIRRDSLFAQRAVEDDPVGRAQ